MYFRLCWKWGYTKTFELSTRARIFPGYWIKTDLPELFCYYLTSWYIAWCNLDFKIDKNYSGNFHVMNCVTVDSIKRNHGCVGSFQWTSLKINYFNRFSKKITKCSVNLKSIPFLAIFIKVLLLPSHCADLLKW